MKKFLVLTILILTVSGCAIRQSPPTNTAPTSTTTTESEDGVVLAALGQQFTLKEGQVAKISNSGLEIKITRFYNSPCPADVQCIWSGVGTDLEYRLNGQIQKGIDLTQAFGYEVTIVETDHETYADLIVRNTTASGQKIYKDQPTCERETGKPCSYTTCDYAPPGKTIEEVCGSSPTKGWTTTR